MRGFLRIVKPKMMLWKPLMSAPREMVVQLFSVRGFAAPNPADAAPYQPTARQLHQKCLIKSLISCSRYHLGSAFGDVGTLCRQGLPQAVVIHLPAHSGFPAFSCKMACSACLFNTSEHTARLMASSGPRSLNHHWPCQPPTVILSVIQPPSDQFATRGIGTDVGG